MNKVWTDEAWEDYLYWQSQDKKTLKRINVLLQDIDRNGYEGIGKPEPLWHEFQVFGVAELMTPIELYTG
jgi:toxin YoeB